MKRITLLVFLFSACLNAQITDVISSGLNNVSDLYFAGNKLYIADYGANKIFEANVASQNITLNEVLTYNSPLAINILSNSIYICGTSTNTIEKYNLNNINNSSTEAFGVNNGSQLIINNNTIYVSQRDSHLISKKDLSSAPANVSTVITATRPNDLYLMGNTMYVAEGDNASVSTFSINDSNPSLTTVISNIGSAPQAITIASNHLYIAVNNPNKIYRISLSDSNPTLQEIVTLDHNIAALAFRGNDLYIAQVNKVSKFNLNTLSSNTYTMEANPVSLYPNPANTIVTIKGIDTINNIKVYDLSGKWILSQTTNIVDISHLESGMYFVTINNSITKKLIKE